MEISLISDTLTTVVATTQGLGFSNYLLNRNINSVLTLSDVSSDQQSPSRQISSVVFPIDALAPPPVKYNKVRSAPRRLARKTRRIVRKSLGSGDEGGDDNGFLFDGGDYDGPFGGGGGGGSGGRGWNFDGYGGANWEESSSFSDPAFDFVYELMCWAALSNCLHFALKKVVRIVADGVSGDPAREKVVVPVRLTTVY
ncbi:hypothetical protein P3S67_016522 [Capsicum chacoense]